MAPRKLTAGETQHLHDFIDSFDHFIFDCDGVLWNGDTLTPNIRGALQLIRSRGKKLAFCTNNATLSRTGYKEKFERLGIDVHCDELFTSASASAQFIANDLLPSLPEHRRGIFVIGQKGLEEELASEKLTWQGGTDPEMEIPLPYQDFSSIMPDPSIGVVLVGFDMRFNYKKMSWAFSLLALDNGEGPKLVLTNDDRTVPTEHGYLAPGEGAIASSLLHARKGLEKDTHVVGKPNKIFFDAISSKLGLDISRTVMIGDRMETDILFGKRGGVKTLFLLSGAGKLSDLDCVDDAHHPDYIAENFGIFFTLNN